MSEQGGRYQRSTAGMVGAMVVTVAVIVAFVAFRGATRDDLVTEPEPVAYLSTVAAIQESRSLPVAYPPELPEGWIVQTVDYDPGALWSLSMLTDDDAFVGVRQGATRAEDLVEEYVDPDAAEGQAVTLDSPLASRWRTFTDDGGDFALVAEVGGTSLLVVGTSGQAEVTRFAESLTTDPLDPS